MIRRGWYMGGDGFRGRLLKRVKEGVQRAVWINHGAAKRAHGEAEAERLLEAGMAALGVSASQLAETGKGTLAEKKALAGWLRQRTTAWRQWVCERVVHG